MGIEHAQTDALLALATGAADFTPTPDILSLVNKTPNQRACAIAIGLLWSVVNKPPYITRQLAEAQARELYRAFRLFGHQAVGPTYGCEEGAPDPHSKIWLMARTSIIRAARDQGLSSILDLALDDLADQLWLASQFWTEGGIRTPCARAKAPDGMPLHPNWTVDSHAYAMVMGLDRTKLGVADPQPLTVLSKISDQFPELQKRVKATTAVQLAVPIRIWRSENGGFHAAMTNDVPMNNRCSWVVTDKSGQTYVCGDSLDSFQAPDGIPTVIGTMATPIPVKPPPTPPIDSNIPAQIRSLHLANSQTGLKERAAAAVEAGDFKGALAIVKSFGIGDGQLQAVTWKAVIAELTTTAGSS